jgi:hypothetical protein
MFDLSLHSWHEPIDLVTLEAAKRGVKIVAPKLGELVTDAASYAQVEWWVPLIGER